MSGSSATSGSRPSWRSRLRPRCRRLSMVWVSARKRLADLPGGQAAQPPQDQGHVRLAVQAGIAYREHHRQLAGAPRRPGASAASIVSVQRRRRRQFWQERPVALFPADEVDRPVVGGPDDPRLRIARQPEAPGLHGHHERVVDDVLGEREVGRTKDLRQRADQVRVLLAEQVLDQLRRRLPQRALRPRASAR